MNPVLIDTKYFYDIIKKINLFIELEIGRSKYFFQQKIIDTKCYMPGFYKIEHETFTWQTPRTKEMKENHLLNAYYEHIKQINDYIQNVRSDGNKLLIDVKLDPDYYEEDILSTRISFLSLVSFNENFKGEKLREYLSAILRFISEPDLLRHKQFNDLLEKLKISLPEKIDKEMKNQIPSVVRSFITEEINRDELLEKLKKEIGDNDG